MTRSTAWQPFTESLAQVLSVLEEHQYLILEPEDEWTYVQFAAQGPQGMRAEAASNGFLSAERQLSPDASQRMTELGWSAPTGNPEKSTPQADPDGSPNFFGDWPRPVPYDKVAQLAVSALVDVFAIAHPGWLQYRAFARGGARLLLPTLNISPAPPEPLPAPTPQVETVDVIRERILQAAREATSNPELNFDNDGDIEFRYDSAAVLVRVFGDPPIVHVFSPVLGEIEATPALTARLNQLNAEQMFAKWFTRESTVCVAMDLFGRSVVADHVLLACSVVGDVANDFDEKLQEEFGGKTFFGEPKPPPSHGIGGYL